MEAGQPPGGATFGSASPVEGPLGEPRERLSRPLLAAVEEMEIASVVLIVCVCVCVRERGNVMLVKSSVSVGLFLFFCSCRRWNRPKVKFRS